LGAGLFASFYIFYATGLIIGCLLLIGGVLMTASVSWTIIRCADHFESKIFEDIALKTYGPNMAKFTSVVMIMS
jgi:amino acid permease